MMLSVLVTAPAVAGPPAKIREMVKKLSTSIPAPAEWQGAWSELDSSYTCSPFALSDVSSEFDTVCAGQQVVPPGSSSSPFTIDCTGTADATTVHMTCTGGGPVALDCSVELTLQLDATRTNETFYSVNRLTIHYVGFGCYGAPDECSEDHIHGTWISSGSAYCATPTDASTWGKVKAVYR